MWQARGAVGGERDREGNLPSTEPLRDRESSDQLCTCEVRLYPLKHTSWDCVTHPHLLSIYTIMYLVYLLLK